MKPTTVTITFAPGEIPKGFRLTGEWRAPKRGEWYLAEYVGLVANNAKHDWPEFRRFILEKLPQKKRKGKKSKP